MSTENKDSIEERADAYLARLNPFDEEATDDIVRLMIAFAQQETQAAIAAERVRIADAIEHELLHTNSTYGDMVDFASNLRTEQKEGK